MRVKTLAVSAAAVGAALLYRRFLREPILTWGATADEANARLPGDELLEDTDGVATRAITIAAPRSAVWPHEQTGATRLISRNRFRLPTLKDRLGMIPMEPGSLLMERKMLLGIKQRAERLAAEPTEPTHV